MATTPLSWGWQLQLWQLQRHLLIDGNNAIKTRTTMPAWWQATRATMLAQQWRRPQRINDSNNTIVTRATIAIVTTAKTPAHWRHQCHHNKSNNASLMTRNEGDNASLTMAEMPVHQQWQWCHHDNGKDSCTLTMATTTATTPAQRTMYHLCVRILWRYCLFEQNLVVLTFPTGKVRSGQIQLHWFQRDTKQLCTPLDCLGGGGLAYRRGKSHIGDFGLATNLIWFFLGRFCILCCVPPKKI